jgi:antitoxin component YwqK of YwqJK toxin-antitoxin module
MGVLDGPVIEFFPSGKVKFKGEYRDGNLDGKVEFFHPNGARKVLGYYEFAVRNKTWTTYDYDGKPKYIQFYKEGRLIWTKTPEQIRKEKKEQEAEESDSSQSKDK